MKCVSLSHLLFDAYVPIIYKTFDQGFSVDTHI